MNNIIPYGTKVRIKDTEIKGHVIAVCMRKDYIEYQISYFVAGDYKTPWVNDFDIEVLESVGKKAGFVNYEPTLFA